MDYYAIGQRIRKFRKARGLTQEQLAEAADISVTHMSHIETGNTKLSLPVFVAIAEILQIQTDELLYDNVPGKFGKLAALDDTIALCTPRQLAVIVDLIKGVKGSLDLVYEEPNETEVYKYKKDTEHI